MRDCIRNSTRSERRLRREAQSAALRERAFALRQAGATYAGIGHELGISLERARQIVRKAERLILHSRWYDRLPQRAVGLLYARGLLERPEFEAAHALAQLSARELMRTFLGEEVDEVWVVFNEFRSVAVQKVVVERLLPIEEPGPSGSAGEGPGVEYLYEPDAERILGALLPRHVEGQIYRILLESAAGEHGARMTAMEAATKNAQEMIGKLTIQYNKARQERITKELLDIVGGAEALRSSAEG